MRKERVFIPKLGMKIKLKTLEQYWKLGTEKTSADWNWLIVEGVTIKESESLVTLRPYDKPSTVENMFCVPLDWINPPLGWQSRYTMYCDNLNLGNHFIDNFARGVEIYQSQNIGAMPSRMFRLAPSAGVDPMPVNWNYTHGYIETLNEQDAKDYIDIVLVNMVSVNLPPVSEKVARAKAIRQVRKEHKHAALPPGSSTIVYRNETKLWPLTENNS